MKISEDNKTLFFVGFIIIMFICLLNVNNSSNMKDDNLDKISKEVIKLQQENKQFINKTDSIQKELRIVYDSIDNDFKQRSNKRKNEYIKKINTFHNVSIDSNIVILSNYLSEEDSIK